jgi:hypothetical protein
VSPFGPSILPQPFVYFRNQPFLPSPAPRNANISPLRAIFLATRHSTLANFPLPKISLPALSSTYKSLSSHHRFATLPLSAAYKSLFSQPLCFLIDTKPRGCRGADFQFSISVAPRRRLPRPARGGKSHAFRNLQPLCPLFALFSTLLSFVFNNLQPLLPKHPGWGCHGLRAPPLCGRSGGLFKRGRRCSSPCAGRKAVHQPARTPHQLPTRPSPRPAAARGRSAPNGIRQ